MLEDRTTLYELLVVIPYTLSVIGTHARLRASTASLPLPTPRSLLSPAASLETTLLAVERRTEHNRLQP